MEEEELIGKLVKGFKFRPRRQFGIICEDKYDGCKGFITQIFLNGVQVTFFDGNTTVYPKNVVVGHILSDYPRLVVKKEGHLFNVNKAGGGFKVVILREGEEGYEIQPLSCFIEGNDDQVSLTKHKIKLDSGYVPTPVKMFEKGKVYTKGDIIFICERFSSNSNRLPIGRGFAGNTLIDDNEPWATDPELKGFKEVPLSEWHLRNR